MQWQQLPLYEDWDYNYSVVIEKINYRIRLLYSDRTKGWTMDIVAPDNVIVVNGKSVNIRDAITLPYYKNLSGVFWLEPKYENINEAYLHPSLVAKYFNLYYGWGYVEEVVIERPLIRNATARLFSITSSLYPLYVEESITTGRSLSNLYVKDIYLETTQEDNIGSVSRSLAGLSYRNIYHEFETTDSVNVSRDLENLSVRSIYQSTTQEDQLGGVARNLSSLAVAKIRIEYPLDEDRLGLVSRNLQSLSTNGVYYTGSFTSNEDSNGVDGSVVVFNMVNPQVVSLTGLPLGLTLVQSGNTFTIAGTSEVFGSYNLTLIVTDDNSKTLNIPVVFSIAVDDLSLEGDLYTRRGGNVVLGELNIIGSEGPFTAVVKSGTLPENLSLNVDDRTVTVVGTSSSIGVFNCVIEVESSNGLKEEYNLNMSFGLILKFEEGGQQSPDNVVLKFEES